MNHGPFRVPIDSVPPGAAVEYCNVDVGVTPCTVTMSTQSSQVWLKLDGYHPQLVDAGRGVNGWMAGNLLLGGFVGLVVDGASGSTTTICTKPAYVAMTPLSEPKPGTWTRPRARSYEDSDEWIPEGASIEPPKPVATKAPKWTPPPVNEDDEGWIHAPVPTPKVDQR